MTEEYLPSRKMRRRSRTSGRLPIGVLLFWAFALLAGYLAGTLAFRGSP